jgi:hypothetical protein
MGAFVKGGGVKGGGLSRLDGWPEILAAHLRAAMAREFAWGAHDCCAFAADGVLAMTGIDPIAPARGRYADEKRAAVVVRDIGGAGVPEAADVLLSAIGAPAIAPTFAQRGDLVLIDAPVFSAESLRAQNGLAGGVLRAETRGWCMGLIALDGRVAVAAPMGLSFFPARQAARAWSI